MTIKTKNIILFKEHQNIVLSVQNLGGGGGHLPSRPDASYSPGKEDKVSVLMAIDHL